MMNKTTRICRFLTLTALLLFTFMAQARGDKDAQEETKQGVAVQLESFNLRYDNPDDGVNAWPERQNRVLKHLLENAADVIGMQEVLAHQLEWLDRHLADYAYTGVGRDDGKRGGEFVPLFYNHTRLSKLEDGYFWLSDTPDVAGSIGWQAHLPRVVTWAKFSKSDKVFFVFNAHFSHVSEVAREKSAEFLLRYIPTIAGDHPVILLGDFNFPESEPAYATLLSDQKLGFKDAAKVNQQKAMGTYNGFGQVDADQRIDYIFISHHLSSGDYTRHKIVEGKRYISDHYPISTEVKLP